jgi:hypothetical protein
LMYWNIGMMEWWNIGTMDFGIMGAEICGF